MCSSRGGLFVVGFGFNPLTSRIAALGNPPKESTNGKGHSVSIPL